MKKLQKFSKPVIMAVMTAVMALSVCMAYLGATEKASAAEPAHFSSVTGGQVTESDILSGDALTGRRLDIVPDEEDSTVTFEYDGVFSAADMMDGVKSIFSFTINDMATVADRKFSVIAITMEDMMNPEEQIVYSLGQYGIAGNYRDFFAARIGYSDMGLTEDAQYSALYSTYKDMFVYHTAIDNNISPGEYALNGNLIAADIRTFFIRYNNTAGSRDISLLPNRDGNYINNIDSQQVYHEGKYKHIEIPELFTSGYYKLKFQILGAKSGLSITLNGDMDASTVPFFKESSYSFSVMEGANIEEDIKSNVLSRAAGAMKEPDISSVRVVDGDNQAPDFSGMAQREEPYVLYATVTSNGMVSNRAELHVTVLEKYTLYDSYVVEIGDGEVPFPVVENLPDGFSYSVGLYTADSSDFENPMFEGLSYAFTDTGEYKVVYRIFDANLNLYNEGEIKFAELIVTDTTAPVISFSEPYESEYNIKEKLTVKTPVVTDNNPSGQPEWSVKAYLGDEEVSVSDGELSMDAAGVYKLIYSFSDKSENEDTYEVRFIVLENDTEKPHIVLNGSYNDQYAKGESIQILEAQVSDNLDENLTADIEVLLNGVALEISDGAIVPEEEGLLLITYSATDSFSNTESLIIRIQITGGNGLSPWAIALIVVGGCVVVAAAVTVTIIVIKKKRGKVNDEKNK